MDDRGLGRFCLDLHANHASKKGVIDQLRASWESAGEGAEADWLAKAEELGRIRGALNTLARTLHSKWRTGISAREAIGRAVRFADIHPVDLDWGSDLDRDDRAGDAAGLAKLEELSRKLGQAFGAIEADDRAAFARVGASAWSHAWVAEMSEGARELAAETGQIKGTMNRFCDAFDLPSPDDAAASVASLAALAEAIQEAGAADLGFKSFSSPQP
jgi:hypothetical protein